jgi:hypothetical protein
MENSRAESLVVRARNLAARLGTLGDRQITFEDASGSVSRSASHTRAYLLEGASRIEANGISMDDGDDFAFIMSSIENSLSSIGPSSYQRGAVLALGAAILAAAAFLA